MRTEIISRVAEFIRNPQAQQKAEKLPVSAKRTGKVADQVEISADAMQKLRESEAKASVQNGEVIAQVKSQWEQERSARLEQIKAQVQSDSYKLDPHMIDQIAENIVKVL